MTTKKRRKKVKWRDLLIRIFAVFVAYAFNAIASGAIVGVPIWKALLMAGIMGTATVAMNIARGLIGDARLSWLEINKAFSAADSRLDNLENMDTGLPKESEDNSNYS